MKEKLENAPILVFLLIGIALAGYNYLGSITTSEQLQEQISQLNTQIKDKKEALAKAQNASSEVPMMKEEINNISQSLSKARELIAAQTTSRTILEKISKEAKDVGVRVVQSRPIDIIQKNYFDELPITVEFEGSYSQLTLLMYSLSKQKSILQPVDMELNIKDIVDRQSNLKMMGNISGFRYKEAKE